MSAALRVALALVLAGAIASVPTAVTDDGTVGFDGNEFVEERGDVVTLPISLPSGGEATLTVESPNYRTTVVVHDDGDGRVRLRLNTYDGTWTAGNGDDLRVRNRTGPPENRTLPTGSYRLLLDADGGDDEATLRLRERRLRRVGLLFANRSLDLRTPADVRQAVASGRLSWFDQLTRDVNVTLVARVGASGLEGALAATPGSNATERFRSVFERETAAFRVIQTNPTVERQPKRIHLGDGTGVVADAANDTYFVVIHPRRAQVTYGDDGSAEYRPGEEFRLNVSFGPDSRLTPPGVRESREAAMDSRKVNLDEADDGRLHFTPAKNQTVTGRTAVGPGWNVTVTLRARDDPGTTKNESFVRRRTVTVRPNPHPSWGDLRGRFEADFDLRNVTAGSSVTVAVSFQGRTLLHDRRADAPESVPGFVAGLSATVSARRADATGRYPAVRADADLSRGGFVVLHAGSADGPVVGQSEFLPPGQHEVRVYAGRPTNASTVVAVAHRDANHNEWFDNASLDPAYDPDDGTAVVPLTSTAEPGSVATQSTAEPGTNGDEPTTEAVTTDDAGVTTSTDSGAPPVPLLAGLLVVAGTGTLLVWIGLRRR